MARASAPSTGTTRVKRGMAEMLKVGEKVVLSWEMDGTVHKALSMTPAS